MISEELLQATGLPKHILESYRLVGTLEPTKEDLERVAEQLGVKPITVRQHISRLRVRLEDPNAMAPVTPNTGKLTQEFQNPDVYAKAVVLLGDSTASVGSIARELGVRSSVVKRIQRDLEGELRPLHRKLVDVRLEDLTKRFGTLARDAIDALTPEKLAGANAQQLAIIAGIAADKWQLLRGQPTQRIDINDRREMNELVKLVVEEAKRRQMEVDVTPEGGVTAKRNAYSSGIQRRESKRVETGDPPETLAPA